MEFTRLSPNHSGQRTHAIDRITPHCVVGQCSVETLGSIFAPTSKQASCNYGIGSDGRVGMYVEEKNRSWCSSSNANDQRAVTIECASDTTEPYAFRDVVYQKLITLCVDICRRNGKKKLIWFGDKEKTLNYSPKGDEMILTVHRWFANKSCPGNWMYARMGDLAAKVTAQLGGSIEQKTETEIKTVGLQATALKGLSEADAVKKVGALFTADQKKSGILASVSLAQFILESGYGSTELAQNANNCFGMKKSLSGNTWGGSTWDGKSIYTKETQEDDGTGRLYTITADFRKYPCVEDSIADHSAYLLGAMNGSKKRYAGLQGCTDYKKAVKIIKDGGYATDTKYVSKICSIIERWNLTQYDLKEAPDQKQEASVIRIADRTIHDITKENLSEVPRSRGSNQIEFIVVHYLGVPNADNPNLYGGGYGGHYNIKVSFDNVRIGTYYMKETTAPSQYALDETVYKVVIEDSKDNTKKSKITILGDEEEIAVTEIANAKTGKITVIKKWLNASGTEIDGGSNSATVWLKRKQMVAEESSIGSHIVTVTMKAENAGEHAGDPVVQTVSGDTVIIEWDDEWQGNFNWWLTIGNRSYEGWISEGNEDALMNILNRVLFFWHWSVIIFQHLNN